MPDGGELVVVPLLRLLNVEGNLDGSAAGAFRGVAIAIGWLQEDSREASPGRSGPRRQHLRAFQATPPPDPHYLVSDMSRPAPIWVPSSAIAQQYHGADVPFPRRDEGPAAAAG